MATANATARHGSSWSAELLTLLGAVLAVGVALGALFFTGLEQVRQDVQAVRADMRTTESRIREDMHAMEGRIREDMQTMEGRLREDMREIRGDVGQLRERVSGLEGRPAESGVSPASS